MKKVVNPLYGQSNYDLSLKCNGGFNNFVIFINNNNIVDINNVSSNSYSFDDNKIENILFTGINYATKYFSQNQLLNNDGFVLLNNDGAPLLNND